MKNILKLTLPMMCLTLLANAEEIAEAEIAKAQPAQSECKPACAEQPKYYEYHNRIAVFCPNHLVYERTKTDAFYVGVEIWRAFALGHRRNVVGEAELRMGYNFFYNGCDHFTPFAGVGVFEDFRSWWWRHSGPSIIYGTVGFLYDHEFNRLFNLGFNLKGLVGGNTTSHHRHNKWGGVVVGLDTDLPITFRFGYKRRWDVRIEPFNVYLHGNHASRNYFGFRNTVGFRF
jgi:hypothetical protein